MIKLEQVSTAGLVKHLMYSYGTKKRFLSEKEQEKLSSYEVLVKYNVINYGKLKDLIESGNLDFQIEFLINALQEMEISLLQADNVAPIYPSNNYSDCGITPETLIETDLETTGDVLLLGNVLKPNAAQRNILRGYSIYFLKQMLINYSIGSLGRVDNALMHNLRLFGEQSAEKVRDAINFYEQQVVRQAVEYPWCKGVDVFSIDKDYKLQAAEEQIKEVMRYLVGNANECIWGVLTDRQKLLLEKVIKGSKTSEGITARDSLIDVISNYTTLGELEEGLVRTRAINRFIKKNN